MATVTLGVAPLDDAARELGAAFRGVAHEPRIDFATVDLLWRVFTAERWELLKQIGANDPVSAEEAARRVGRDEKDVRDDVEVLLRSGILEQAEDGRVRCPYDAVHVDFTVANAA